MKKIFKIILLSQALIYSSFVSATTTCVCGSGSAEANGCAANESCEVGGVKCGNIPDNQGKQGICVSG